MTGIQTQWHLAELTASDADPFAVAVYSAGLEVRLDSSEEELFGHLRTLVRREARLDGLGVRCELKDAGQDCRTCVIATLEPEEPRSRLCKLGKDQVAITERCNELAAVRVTPEGEIATCADDWSEIGHLDADLAELLTAVGL